MPVLKLDGDDRNDVVALYVRGSRAGYELGVVTPASMKRSSGIWDHKECLPLATIPWTLMRQFLWRDGEDSIDAIRRDLTNGGWILREPEPMIGAPLRIEHPLAEVAIESV